MVLSLTGRHDRHRRCALTLLKEPLHQGEQHGATRIFGWFNRTGFNRNAERYERRSENFASQPSWILIYVLLLGGMVFLFCVSPPPFLHHPKIGACSLRLSSCRAVLRSNGP